MKNLSLLQKKASMALFLCMSVGLFSCSTEEEFSPVNEKVIPALEVSKMSDWLPNTRSSFDESDDMPVLHFKDEQACNETIAKLNEMDKEERETYFKNIGFDGAYTIWNHADEELEQIFEIEDSIRFEKEISSYKEKYDNIFAFNTVDTYDATPYLTFTDDDLSLVGNIKGYVVIGNTLKMPENNTPTFDVDDEVAHMQINSIQRFSYH